MLLDQYLSIFYVNHINCFPISVIVFDMGKQFLKRVPVSGKCFTLSLRLLKRKTRDPLNWRALKLIEHMIDL